ncbi:CpaF family protein [Bacillus paralicheniformis]|uniref:ATPase, T2SS/T4P/T4SS family n=1 Tax=Bacillus TaxID=1386 RepID=UPI0013EE5DDD|nr:MULTISPECIES: ATPase, T2SS/T4P/T4SS family [Bacillus]QII26950.1 CpaF family protein [Bacillus altitudinis]QII51418.1 CpaF family protein [Bacillus paralicheniformis]
MKNIVHYRGLVSRERNIINLERLLYQKVTESKPKPKIKFSNQFQQMTDNIKEHLNQEQYRELLKDSFGNKLKQNKLREVIYSKVSSPSFLKSFSAQLADYKLDYVTNVLVEKITGLDVLQGLTEVDTITDINCIDWNNIWVDDIYKGTYKTDISFESEQDYLDLCNRFAFASGKQYSMSKPSVDAVFPHLRVNFVGQDLSPKVSLQIRVISKELRLSEKFMLETGYANQLMIDFLKATFLTESHLISGATGTGKTELLRYFLKYTADNGNMIVIEDTPETYLDELYPYKPIKMWKNREALDGEKNEFGYSYHIRNAMRQHPRYIIIQESRGKESWDVLKAVETGHVVNTTLHSESAIDSIDRFIDLCEEAQHHEAEYYGKRITRKFKLGIHTKRYGKKQVRKISQIVEYETYENNEVKANVLFEYDHISQKHIQKGRVSTKLWNRLLEAHEDLSNLSALAPTDQKVKIRTA